MTRPLLVSTTPNAFQRPLVSSTQSDHSPYHHVSRGDLTRSGVRLRHNTLQKHFVNRTAAVKQTGVQMITRTAKDLFTCVYDRSLNFISWLFGAPGQKQETLPPNATRQEKHQYRQIQRHLQGKHKKQNEQPPSPSFLLSSSEKLSPFPREEISPLRVEPQKQKTKKPEKASKLPPARALSSVSDPNSLGAPPKISSTTRLKETERIDIQEEISNANLFRLSEKHRIWIIYIEKRMVLQRQVTILDTRIPFAKENKRQKMHVEREKMNIKLKALEKENTEHNNAFDFIFGKQKTDIINNSDLNISKEMTSPSSSKTDFNTKHVECQQRQSMIERSKTFMLIHQEYLTNKHATDLRRRWTQLKSLNKETTINNQHHKRKITATYTKKMALSSLCFQNLKTWANEECTLNTFDELILNPSTHTPSPDVNETSLDCERMKNSFSEITKHLEDQITKTDHLFQENEAHMKRQTRQLYENMKTEGVKEPLNNLLNWTRSISTVQKEHSFIINKLITLHTHLLTQRENPCVGLAHLNLSGVLEVEYDVSSFRLENLNCENVDALMVNFNDLTHFLLKDITSIESNVTSPPYQSKKHFNKNTHTKMSFEDTLQPRTSHPVKNDLFIELTNDILDMKKTMQERFIQYKTLQCSALNENNYLQGEQYVYIPYIVSFLISLSTLTLVIYFRIKKNKQVSFRKHKPIVFDQEFAEKVNLEMSELDNEFKYDRIIISFLEYVLNETSSGTFDKDLITTLNELLNYALSEDLIADLTTDENYTFENMLLNEINALGKMIKMKKRAFRKKTFLSYQQEKMHSKKNGPHNDRKIKFETQEITNTKKTLIFNKIVRINTYKRNAPIDPLYQKEHSAPLNIHDKSKKKSILRKTRTEDDIEDGIEEEEINSNARSEEAPLRDPVIPFPANRLSF